MRVSVTLHTDEPPPDGNQRTDEAQYCGFNRQYAELVKDPATGHWSCEFKALTFPNVDADPETLTHFSLGVCDAPADRGGAIIIAGPLDNAIDAQVGTSPQLSAIVGVKGERITEMLADERLFSAD
jgi:hypothetical protein